jgi:hypothetical protein
VAYPLKTWPLASANRQQTELGLLEFHRKGIVGPCDKYLVAVSLFRMVLQKVISYLGLLNELYRAILGYF